jgi:hypothetical protein
MASGNASSMSEFCVLPQCSRRFRRRSDLLMHVRVAHADVALSSSQLATLQAEYCKKCGILKSSISGAHRCPRFGQGSPQRSVAARLEGLQQAPPDQEAAGPAEGGQQRVAAPLPAGNAAQQPEPAEQQEPEQQQQQPPPPPAAPPQAGPPGLGGAPQAPGAAGPLPAAATPAPMHTSSTALPLRRVPAGARVQFARAVVHAIEAVKAALQRGHEPAICCAVLVLLQLPTTCLVDTGASRGRTRRIRARARDFANGTAQAAAEAGPQPNRPQRPEAARKASRMHSHMQMGAVSRAAKVMEGEPLAEPTAENIEALRAQHPPEREPPEPRNGAARNAAVIDENNLDSVMRDLPRGSAPGPSGWTYEHQRAVALADPEAFSAILWLMNALVSGALPHVQELLDSALIGTQKPGGGVRPIAIGDVWLRLASRCAMAACPDIGPGLAPLQLGVGTRGGPQVLAQALKAGMEADPDCVTVKVDVRNAFNSVRRERVLSAVAELAPTLLPFAWWTYRQHSRLFVRGAPEGAAPLSSQRGVRQGDPCGMLYFGLALQGGLERIQQRHPACRVAAIADDIYLQGAPAQVQAAFRTLDAEVEDLGATVSMQKCGAYSTDGAAAAGVATALGITHFADGFLAAGTPLGTDEFVRRHVQAKADSTCALVDDLVGLPLPAQDKFVILRMSLQARMAHFARTVPWDLLGTATAAVQGKLEDAVFGMMQRPREGEAAQMQVALPLRLGGFGLRKLDRDTADAAELSAAGLTQAAMHTGPAAFQPFGGVGRQRRAETWARLHGAAGDTVATWSERSQLSDAVIRECLPSAQREWSKFAALRDFKALLALVGNDTVDGRRALARLLSCASRGSSLWLDTCPSAPCLTINDSDYIFSMRHRMGFTQVPLGVPAFACFCGRRALPADHGMVCPSLSGAMTTRHNIVMGPWRRIGNRAGVPSSVEPVLAPLRRREGQEAERGDILMVMPDTLKVADVSVIHPAAASYALPASKTAGAAAEIREQSKKNKYAANAGENAFQFVPLVHESYGRLGKDAMAFLGELANAAVGAAQVGSGVTKQAFITGALRELSVALCRGNGVVCRASLQCVARASGTGFREGMPMPSAEVF